MSAETVALMPLGHRESAIFILELAGWRRLAVLSALMLAGAMTEGVGLLMLIPLTQSVVGGDGEWLGGWIPDLPLPFLLAIFVALIAGRSVLTYFSQNLQRKVGIDSIRRLRTEIREAVMHAEWRWLSAQSGADHTALIMGMAERIGYLAVHLLQLAAASITLAILIVTALMLSWQLTLAGLGLAALVSLPIMWMKLRPTSDGRAYTRIYARLQGLLQQGISHLRAARIAGAGPAMRAEFDEVSAELGQVDMAYGRKLALANGVFQVFSALALAMVVWLAIGPLAVPLALLVPVMAIFIRVAPLANTIQQGIRNWQFSRPTIDEMRTLLRSAREAAEPEAGTFASPRLREALVLQDVRVRYDGRENPILSGLDLVIPAGAVVAVTGPSGSGKSTLADLISGLLLPDAGAVTVDGVPLTGPARVAWRSRVAYVEQAPFLFEATVRANLDWGLAEVADAELERALEAASAQFVFDLPNGLDTLVGETGRQLSGGEKQRIALARALLRRPDLLLLDETTSSLDQVNEEMIAQSIRRLKGDCTIVIFGHRAGMTALADVVVDLGPERE